MNKDELKGILFEKHQHAKGVEASYSELRSYKIASYHEGRAAGYRETHNLIDQLDEPETLTQEWIDKYIDDMGIMGKPFIYAEDLKGLLLPKPEKPVVPDFVGEFIESCKGKPLKNLFWVFATAGQHKHLVAQEKAFDWIRVDDNDELFARAWLDGYTVEEKKYRVELLDGHRLGIYGDGEIAFVKGLNGANTVFTEQEIKDIDERYWPFAKEVTE